LGLTVWLVGSVVFLYVPQFAVRSGKYERKDIAQAYHSSGLLLMVFGAASSALVLGAGKAAGICEGPLEATQISMLALTAVTGGALCADSILGLEVDRFTHRISPGYAVGVTLLLVVVCSTIAFILGAEPGCVLGFCLVIMGGSAPLIAAVRIAAWKDEHRFFLHRPIIFAACGLIAVAFAVLGLFLILPSIHNAGARDFVKNFLPAYSAAIGACLLARALESNVYKFRLSEWAESFKELAPGTTLATSGSTLTLTLPENDQDCIRAIEVHINDNVLRSLRGGSEVLRMEVRDKALERVTDRWQSARRHRPNDRLVTYHLEPDVLPR
jgi:hypothetical protein